MIELTARENDNNRRLDRIIRKHFPDFALSFIARLLREQKILVNNAAQKGSFRVNQGDKIIVMAKNEMSDNNLIKQNKFNLNKIKLEIIFEDDNLLIVNKPKGLLTHGENSLEKLVKEYLAEKISASLSFTPGPLHRLDRNTSGLIVFGKSLKGAHFFTEALQNGRVKKHYRAIVDGFIEKEEIWEDFLFRENHAKKTFSVNDAAVSGAKKAITKIHPLEKRNNQTFVEVEIATGLTHQIRAQCALHGHPLSGDIKYGGSFRAEGYYLNAYKIIILGYNGQVLDASIAACF